MSVPPLVAAIVAVGGLIAIAVPPFIGFPTSLLGGPYPFLLIYSFPRSHLPMQW